jgi:pSer/pThr/pTyr-binding forkhead associated (FHA) protein
MYLTLKLMNGEVIEEETDLNVITIGRSSKCTIVVPHEGMSRQHCQIEVINGSFFVTDLNSTNGVFIDGQKIPPSMKVPYQTFLGLSFGTVSNLQIEVEDPLTPASEGASVSKKEVLPETGTRLTKTKVLFPNRPPEPVKINIASSKNQNSKFSHWAMNIMATLLLLGAVLWYAQKEENIDGPPDIEENVDLSKPPKAEQNYDQF